MWATAGIQTNPTSGAVIADTGPLTGGLSTFRIIIATTVAVAVIIANRDAANATDLNSQVIPAQIGLTPPIEMPIDVVPGGRVIVRMNAALTGLIQAAILRD